MANFHIAYVTDKGLFLPTLMSLDSALAQARSPLHVAFVGQELDGGMQQAVRRVADVYPQHQVDVIALPPEWLTGATENRGYIPPAGYGRMFLPRFLKGRVLYIDGDTLVTGDLSAAAAIDLCANPIGGVHDYSVRKWRAMGRDKPLEVLRKTMQLQDASGYINSGVLLIDLDRLTPADIARMEDMTTEGRNLHEGDQDWINIIFHNRITALDPAWNCSWGRLDRQRRMEEVPVAGRQPGPVILHFHGPNKPWHKLRLKTWRRGVSAILRYRRALADFRRRYPDLPA